MSTGPEPVHPNPPKIESDSRCGMNMSGHSLVMGTLTGILDLLYPPICLICRNSSLTSLCSECISRFGPMPSEACNVCLELPSSTGKHSCGMKGLNTYSTAFAGFGYSGVVREAIHLYKFESKRQLADPLGHLLSARMIEMKVGSGADLVVSVPLHRKRERERGFNQSAEIARVVARNLGVPFRSVLEKTRHTDPQVGLSGPERRENIIGVFQLIKSCVIDDKRILLVDDVATTMSTLNECSKVLKAANAKSVRVIALAHGY